MSYGRNPYYIWSDGEKLNFYSGEVSESEINAFLYKILLSGRREELKSRLLDGKQQWMKKYDFDTNTLTMCETEQDQDYVDWMDEQEDEVIKNLMGKSKNDFMR